MKHPLTIWWEEFEEDLESGNLDNYQEHDEWREYSDWGRE